LLDASLHVYRQPQIAAMFRMVFSVSIRAILGRGKSLHALILGADSVSNFLIHAKNVDLRLSPIL
jgi:hypothetical protein